MNLSKILAMIACAFIGAGCDDGNPIVLNSSRVASPDGRWEATLEQVDNGLGFGMGRWLYEIHVQPAGTVVMYHGDPSITSVFYADEVSDAEKYRPEVKWVGPRQLVVRYPMQNTAPPAKALRGIMDVKIAYEAVPVERWP